MSHMVAIKVEIKSLDALQAACRELGLEFKRNQKTAKFYGGIHQCEHAIAVPGTDWEIALNRQGNGSFAISMDTFGGRGRPILEAVGKDGWKLNQLYGVQCATMEARRKGFTTQRRVDAKGNITLTVNC